MHYQAVVQVQHWAAWGLQWEWKGSIGSPALRMLSVRTIRRGGDCVSYTPALTIDNGVHVPHGIHFFVQVDEDLVDVSCTWWQIFQIGSVATAAIAVDNLAQLLRVFFRVYLGTFLQQGFAIPNNQVTSGILHLFHGVIHIGIQNCEVLVVGHNGLLQWCQDVLEVILGLGGDVLEPFTFLLFLSLLQFHLLGFLEATQLQGVEAASLVIALIIVQQGGIQLHLIG
mmetsp:Transcript_99227/g.137878  ORF Transcript_99227/g.137878 Transcript_99227/m.137878 type:complete len:226 (-) Transcript_99227:114-791(-)